MDSAKLYPGSFDPNKFNTSCFVCSNNYVSLDYSNNYLQSNGIHNSDDEKRKIMSVVCQLLRVKWDIVQELFTNNVYFPFCEYCLEYVMDLVVLREELFQIETNVREKIKHIESTIAKSYKRQKLVDQSEWKNKKTKYNHYQYRQNFQGEVMEEYWNKELLRKKIEELNGMQHDFPEANLSLIQLQLEKNVFRIEKARNKDIVTENLDEFIETEKNADISHEFLDIGIRDLGHPTSKNVSDDENFHNGHDDSSMLTLSKKSMFAKTSKLGENTCTSATPNQSRASTHLKSNNFLQNCDCGTTEANCVLICKLCGKRVERTQEKFKQNSKTEKSNECQFCPAKFANLKLLQEHIGNIHFSSAHMKAKQGAKNDSDESRLDEAAGDGSDNLGACIYDPEEIAESPSEGEYEPIMSDISSDESSSEGEKIAKTAAKPVPITQRKLASRRKHSSIEKKSIGNGQAIPKNDRCHAEVKEYMAKDKTVWTTLEPSKNKIRRYNILREDGKFLGKAADPSLEPVELFKLMISPDMVDLIVKYSNSFAESFKSEKVSLCDEDDEKKYDYRLFNKPISQEEIYAFIGILLYLGLEKKSKFSINQSWSSNLKYTIPCIAATMSRHRFLHLCKFIRFDDQIARRKNIAQGIIPEKLSYVSEIFNPFVKNIGSYLQPYDNLVVDEMLIKFKGTSKFRVYMKSKPGRYGIKIWACCDTKTGYVLRLIIYEGKQGDKVETELGRKVVLRLVKSYFGTGRGVTTDNFFTSKALAHDLMEQNMSLLGTLNKNRMDVIPDFVEGKGREIESSIFAFQNDLTMVSYTPRKNKTVVLMSTQHHSVDTNPDIKNKPQMILDYNKTKGAVDTADQMIASSSCQRATKRWPMKIFFAMCDIGALNAYHIWKIHQRESKKNPVRLNFLRLLSEALMAPLVKVRALDGLYLSTNTKRAMELMGFPVPATEVVGEYSVGNRGRCMICTGSGRKSTRSGCSRCKKWICKPHTILVRLCVTCNKLETGNTDRPSQKMVKNLEQFEETPFPIRDYEPNIFTTPVKHTTQGQIQLNDYIQGVNPMGIRAPVKKIHTLTSAEYKQNKKSKYISRKVFYDMDEEESNSDYCLEDVSKNTNTLESEQLPPFNLHSPENNFNQINTLEPNFAPSRFVDPLPAQYHHTMSSEMVAPSYRELTMRQQNFVSETQDGNLRQFFLNQNSTQATSMMTLPQKSLQFVQPRYPTAYPNGMNSRNIVSNHMQPKYVQADSHQHSMLNSNMVFKQNLTQRFKAVTTPEMETCVFTQKTNVLRRVPSNPEANYTREMETIDLE